MSNPTPTTVEEMRQWLRQWVATTTEQPVEAITDDKSMDAFGLSSRDVVVLSGDLERLLGVHLDATIAYEFNTIDALATYLIDGRGQRTPSVYGSLADAAPASSTSGHANPADRDVAIVGMAGRYPGANSAREMWDMLIGYADGIGQPPAGRWAEYSGDPVMTQRMAEAELTGGYLDDIAAFDNEFFGLSPLEAENMDPQQRILLQLTWEALEDAHIPANTLRGRPVGVFMGTTSNDYGMLISADPQAAHPYALTGNSTSIIANRLSYAFDFRGPSIAVDTACSSSLVAIHQAVRSLRDGDSSLAVAGGVNILASPFASVAFSELGVLSPTGQIHAFSDDADGIVRSDGAGVLILKRLSDAQRDGDDILAVIKGSAVNSDGRSNGLTAPNPDAQVAVLQAAYADAGIDPAGVDYVEAHGTGTILGDPIEATALGTVLGAQREPHNPLLLGSAKTNFGHTEAAAGVAGVMKVAMAMREGVLPPSLHYAGPNPYIDFDTHRLEVVEDAREWPEYSGLPVAGVSGFGFGGTNAHVVIAAPPATSLADAGSTPVAALTTPTPADSAAQGAEADGDSAADGDAAPAAPARLITVSGLLPSRRRAAAADLADWLEAHPEVDLASVARATAGRNHGRSRAVVTARTVEEAIAGLRRVAKGKTGRGVVAADAPARTGAVWVYSGFGSQHRKMAKDLYAIAPTFADTLRTCDAVVQRESGYSIIELILDDERTFDTETAQVGITCIQIALTDFLRDLGVTPAAVVGQSMGEIAAAYAVGGLSLDDAVRIAAHRSRLMGEGEQLLAEDQQGAMAVVEFGVDELATFSAEHPEFSAVEPAVYAAPGMTTVGGPREPVEKLVAYLEEEGKFARLLNVKGAGHTSMLDPILGELHFEINDILARPIHTPLYSTVDRKHIYRPGDAPHDAEYFVRCTRQPVWFSDATGQQFDDGFRTFIEISPNPVALMPLLNTAFAHNAADATLIYLLKRKEDATTTVLSVLAELYAQGADLDLAALVGPGPRAAIPGIRWNLQHHWTTARPSSGAAADLPGTRVSLPDGRVAFGIDADLVPSVLSLAEAVAEQLAPDSTLIADENTFRPLPTAGSVTTVATSTAGGWAIDIFDASSADVSLLGSAFASTIGSPSAAAAATGTPASAAPAGGAPTSATNAASSATTTATTTPAPAPVSLTGEDDGGLRWDPNSGESVSDRLRTIVSEAMGYDVDDLPGELPLIDLGLDSLMGMRIKNRVEHDFDLPPLQVQELRDGSVDDVIATVERMVAERHSTPDSTSLADAAPAPTTTDTPADSPSARATGGVAPRDASERLVFATWARLTGAALAGVTTELPAIDRDTAAAIAERLNERAGSSLSAEDIIAASDLAALADAVRDTMESDVEGNVRVLRARPEGSTQPSVFVFHPAGGSSVVYQPLTRRLPADVPVYGIERREGPLAERVAAYLEEIIALADGRPVVLAGWSFGGALAYETAHQLAQHPDNPGVARIHLLDTVQPANPAPDTKEEMHARWDRYAAFAAKTYGLEFEVPHELLEQQGEEVMIAMFGQILGGESAGQLGLPAGVLEHQRASFVDNRILDSLDFRAWDAVDVPVTLFRAERMHDGAIELEPAFADIAPDGGWGAIVEDLEIVQLNGDHLAVVDEPEIGTVATVIARHLED